MRHFSTSLFVAAAIPLFAPLAHAEGARLKLECVAVGTCQPNGMCKPGTDSVVFNVAPSKIDAQGIGAYQMTRNSDAPVDATGLTQLGPFLWTDADGLRNTLTMSQATTAVHVRQDTTGANPAIIDLLNCMVTF